MRRDPFDAVSELAASSSPTPLRAAMEACDHAALLESLTPDVVPYSPIIDVPFQGLDEIGDQFAAEPKPGSRVRLLQARLLRNAAASNHRRP